jgi:hypothetical protein
MAGSSRLPERLAPTDPYLAILETLLVLLAPVMIVLMVSVHAYVPRGQRAFTRVALALTTVAAGLTCSIHFMQLTAVRRLAAQGAPGLAPVQFYPWPSPVFALDLLVWDLFLGLALLFAAPAFRGDRLHDVVRVGMRLSGGLCVAGLLGPALGDLRLQYLGILGHAGGFPAVCALLGILFRKSRAAPDPALQPTVAHQMKP